MKQLQNLIQEKEAAHTEYRYGNACIITMYIAYTYIVIILI